MFTNPPQRESSSRRESVSPHKSSINAPPPLSQAFRHLQYSTHRISEYVLLRVPRIIIAELPPNKAAAKPKEGSSLVSNRGEGSKSRRRLMRACTHTVAKPDAGGTASSSFTVVIPTVHLKRQNAAERASTSASTVSQRVGQKRKKITGKGVALEIVEANVVHCFGCDQPFSSESFLKAHQQDCIRALSSKGTDIREGNDSGRKLSFMQLFGMVPSNLIPVATSTSACSESVKNQIKLALEGPKRKRPRRPRSAHLQVVHYFRKNPFLPITGQHGQRLMKESGAGLISNPGELAMKVDKVLNEKSDSKERPIRTQRLKESSKKPLPNQYLHKYHFGKQGRTKRNTELVLGLKTKYFPYLNMCREFKIRVKALSNNEVAKVLAYPRVLPKQYDFVLKKCSVELVNMKDTEEGRQFLQARQPNLLEEEDEDEEMFFEHN